MNTRIYKVNFDDYEIIEDMVTNFVAGPVYLESDDYKNVMLSHDKLAIEIKAASLNTSNVDAFLMKKDIVLENNFDCINVLSFSENTGHYYIIFTIEPE